MMRFPAIPTVFLLLVLMGALVALPHNLVPPPDRQVLTSLLTQRTNMQVTLAGDIRLRFLPRPQLILSDVEMSGRSNANDALSISVPQVVLNLDLVALGRQQFDIASVIMLYPVVTAQLRSTPHHLLADVQGDGHPGLHIKQGKMVIAGLNHFDKTRVLSVPALSLTVPARQAGAPIRATLRHTMEGGETAVGDFKLGVPFGGRYSLVADIRLGAREKIQFDGDLATRADWQLDGELAFSSGSLLAQVVQHYVPLKIAPTAQYIAFDGLVRGDKSGLRTGTLEVNALGTTFQTRLALQWPQQPDQVPNLIGRMSTGTLNLNNLSLADGQSPSPSIFDAMWRSLATQLAVTLRIEANRYDLAGESGSNLSLDFDYRDRLVEIERLSLDLPFRSSLIATGTLNLANAMPSFIGSFSARSLDSLAALIWLGDQAAQDFSGFAELIDDAGLQRASLISDINWSENQFRLAGMSGRIGDDVFAGAVNLSDRAGPRLEVDLDFDRFDLTDWGVAEAGNARDVDVNSVWQPLNRLLEAQLAESAPGRIINLDFKASQLYFGTTALGPAEVQAAVLDRQLTIEAFRLRDIQNANVQARGQLDYAVSPVAGRINLAVESEALGSFADPLLDRLAPLRFNADRPLKLSADILLTGREATDWPNTTLAGSGRLGDLQLQFGLITPSRTLDYSVTGSTLSVSMAGQANDLAASLLLPSPYQADAMGEMQLQLAAQSNNVSALTGRLALAQDTLDLTGSLRPSADGALLDGVVTFSFADSLPLMGLAPLPTALPLAARAQLTATADKIGFNGVEGSWGDGALTGEGVLQFEGEQPQLTARIGLEKGNFDWVMPRFSKQGWSSQPMRWSAFALGRADLDVQISEAQFGQVPIDKLTSRLRLIDGVLEAPQIEAALLGGRAEGRLLAEGGQLTPLFNLEASFSDISPAGPLLGYFGNRLVDAPVSGTLSLRGRGTSAAAMMGALDGDVQLEIGAGALAFVDLQALAESLADINQSDKPTAIVQRHIGAGSAEFSRGLGLLQIRKGRSDNATAEFVFAPPHGDARLALNVDWLTRQVAGQFDLYPQAARPVSWQVSGDALQPRLQVKADAYAPRRIVVPAETRTETTAPPAAQATTSQ